MQANIEGLLIDQIFKLASALSKDARLNLAVILTKGDSRVKVIDTDPGMTDCPVPHSKYDPCHNCDDPSP